MIFSENLALYQVPSASEAWTWLGIMRLFPVRYFDIPFMSAASNCHELFGEHSGQTAYSPPIMKILL